MDELDKTILPDAVNVETPDIEPLRVKLDAEMFVVYKSPPTPTPPAITNAPLVLEVALRMLLQFTVPETFKVLPILTGPKIGPPTCLK
jgi:hypothetical protein